MHAYPDPFTQAEPWTIGWGTTHYPDGRAVGQFDSITQEEADAFFLIQVQEKYWEPLGQTIPFWQEMNAPMRSALCSFAYHLGAGFFGAEGFDTISACLREKRWEDVPSALMLYVNPGSAVEAGLRRRRQAEGHLWSRGVEQLSAGHEPPALQMLEAITETFLKKEKRDSSELGPHQLVPVETGERWKIEALLRREEQSQQVRLAYGAGDWWIYAPHWRDPAATLGSSPSAGASANRPDASGPPAEPLPASVDARDLPVPYPTKGGLEDELYQKLEELGRSRHNPYGLKFLIETYLGCKDIFRENGSFSDVKTSINAGNPVIVHGYFTQFGHIIVIRGYDDSGFLVNDPYGEWFSTGYDNSRSGERLHYSNGLIARTCSPESVNDPKHIWCHTVFKV